MYTWGACQLDLGGKETFVRARVDIKKLYAYIWPDTRKIFLRPKRLTIFTTSNIFFLRQRDRSQR